MTKKSGLSLWPLAFLSALLPLIAVHASWWISITNEYVPICIPYIDGCTSISRSARQGLANSIFKIIMLPIGILQALTWFGCREWLRKTHTGKSLPYLGMIAGLFLALYVTFLGTDGDIYRMLRRYGINFYFGATYVAQLVMISRIRLVASGVLPKIMTFLTLILFPAGILGLYLSATTMDVPLNDEIENIVEWNFSLVMTVWYFFLAEIWRRQNLKITVS